MRKLTAALMAVAVTGCAPDPVWRPGDGILTVSVDGLVDGVTTYHACLIWKVVDLACAIDTLGDGELQVYVGRPSVDGRVAETDVGAGAIIVDYNRWARHPPDVRAAIIAHEMGHAFGIFHHVDGHALMSSDMSSLEATDLDLKALMEDPR